MPPKATQLSNQELMARILELEKRNATLEASNRGNTTTGGGLTIKVGEKHVYDRNGQVIEGEHSGQFNVRVYGLQRNPITLWPNQWLRLLDAADDIRSVIEENKDILTWSKDDVPAPQAQKRRKARV